MFYSFSRPNARCPAGDFPMTGELAINLSPLFEISFAQSDKATKMSWTAVSCSLQVWPLRRVSPSQDHEQRAQGILH